MDVQPWNPVNRTFQRPAPPPGLPAQRLPSVRYHVATGSETLYGLAQSFYGNPREAARIYNANRAGTIRDDKTQGMLMGMNGPLEAGTILLIP